MIVVAVHARYVKNSGMQEIKQRPLVKVAVRLLLISFFYINTL